MGKRFRGRPDDTVIFLDKEACGVRVPDHGIILEIEQFVVVGGIWGFVQCFVEQVWVGTHLTGEDDVILGDLPC